MKSIWKTRELKTHYLELPNGKLVQISYDKALLLGLIEGDKHE